MLARTTIISALIILLALAATQAPTPDPLTDIRDKYPWGSIYLTYTTLVDLAITFQRAKSPSTFGDVEAVQLLNAFVTKTTGARSADSAAFLQLDLVQMRAGFIPNSVVQGTVTQINWSPAQVRKIALFVDQYLVTNSTAFAFTTDMARHGTIGSAWQELSALTNNPLVAPRIAKAADLAFRDYLKSVPKEFQEFRVLDPALAKTIEAYTLKLDKQIEHSPLQQYTNGGPDSDFEWTYHLAPTYIRTLPARDGWGNPWAPLDTAGTNSPYAMTSTDSTTSWTSTASTGSGWEHTMTSTGSTEWTTTYQPTTSETTSTSGTTRPPDIKDQGRRESDG